MAFKGGPKEKWLRIVTGIGALYLDSCMHEAVVPLLSNLQWAESNVTSDSSPDGDLDVQASSTVSVVFFSTGMTEILLSPVAGMVADLWGLDIVVLFGLLVATLKCVLYGLVNTSLIIVLINRMLQGAISACTQTMAMARIRDVYDQVIGGVYVYNGSGNV